MTGILSAREPTSFCSIAPTHDIVFTYSPPNHSNDVDGSQSIDLPPLRRVLWNQRKEERLSKIKEEKLTWANVNTDDPEEMKRFREQQAERAGERIRKAVTELQELGIMDEEGRPVKKELPPDMQPDSKTDV